MYSKTKMIKIFSQAFILTAILSIAALNHAHADLIAYYTFEAGADDVTGNGYNGSVTGAVLSDSGYSGKAYSFDGNSYIKIDLNINPSNYAQLTMGAWVKADQANLTGTDIRHQVISHDNGLYDRTLGIDWRGDSWSNSEEDDPGWSAFAGLPPSGYTYHQGGGVLGDVDVDTDTWVFIAAVYDQDAQSVMLYVDGQIMTRAGVMGEGMEYLHIGSNPPNTYEAFHGLVDNVFFFDQALTQNQLDSVMTNGVYSVPVPASFLLLCTGLLVLAGFRGGRRLPGWS